MAKNAKQQAAIAMSMKKAGKKPKSQGQKNVKKFKAGGTSKLVKHQADTSIVNSSPTANQLKILNSLKQQANAVDAYNQSIMDDYRYNASRTTGRANLNPADYIKKIPQGISYEQGQDMLKNMYKKFDQKKFDELIARKKGGSTYKKGGAVKKSIKSKKK